MEQIAIGISGLKASRIGLGTWAIGGWISSTAARYCMNRWPWNLGSSLRRSSPLNFVSEEIFPVSSPRAQCAVAHHR